MTRDLDELDYTHGLLLGAMLPLLVLPGPARAPRPRLRGVVRASGGRSRVSLTLDSTMQSGVAFDIPLAGLHRDGGPVDVDQVVARLRSVVSEEFDGWIHDATLPSDTHGNRLVEISGEEVIGSSAKIEPEQELFTVFQLIQRGPIMDSFKDVFRFTGFMFRGDETCRIYVSVLTNGISYGLDIPLQRIDGRPISGIATSFGLELAMKLGNDGELFEPVADRSDEYCTLAYDLGSWVNPLQG